MDPPWALAEADSEFPLDLECWPSLEAQVAAVADDIAYDNHDVDDGLRAGLFALAELLEVPMISSAWSDVRTRHPDVDEARLVPELIRDQIGLMVNDVLQETTRRLREADVEGPDDVRAAGRPLAGFSPTLAPQERALKAFLHARMYNAPAVTAVRDAAQRVAAGLFEAYRDDPRRLPPGWLGEGAGEVATLRAIGDFIAGMTDRYAVARYRELVGPAELPEGF
jgi:dGTPase